MAERALSIRDFSKIHDGKIPITPADLTNPARGEFIN